MIAPLHAGFQSAWKMSQPIVSAGGGPPGCYNRLKQPLPGTHAHTRAGNQLPVTQTHQHALDVFNPFCGKLTQATIPEDDALYAPFEPLSEDAHA